MMDHFY